MLTEKKYKLLKWAVIILLILNISTISSIIWHVNQPSENTLPKRIPPFEQTNRSGKMRDVLHNNLNLDNNQKILFDKYHNNFRQEAYEIALNMEILREEILKELMKNEPDRKILHQYSEEIGNAHRDLKILTYQFFLDLKKVCNPEQTIKLEKMFRTIMQVNPPDGKSRRNKGGRHRNGFGKQNKVWNNDSLSNPTNNMQ
ncbi:MAG: periplasmic heavy metal sensor [Marinilabiliaceae bacterium]|nr:periplasmic heavy metal sensor [Marinilabiliaceae bacterium]